MSYFKGAAVAPRTKADFLMPGANHFKESSITPELRKKIAAKGLVRVAGNLLTCKSTKDFWAIKGGKLVRVTVQEVDNGESLMAAEPQEPSDFISGAMSDITF